MKITKIPLLSLCWASLMPAIEAQKEPSVYEQVMKLRTLAKGQKTAVRNNHYNQSVPLLQLPNETLEAIAIKLLPLITHAHSEDELKKSIQAVTRLQQSCTRFNAVINDGHYQKELKTNLQAALNNLNIPLDLHLAIDNKRSHFVINTIIKAGAKLDIQDKDGWTALMRAAIRGRNDVVDTLIKAGADIKITDKWGQTALIWAASKGYNDIVDTLIKAGAKLDIKDIIGWTALMHAAIRGRNDVVATLIKAGAKLDIKDFFIGKTALDIAREEGHTTIVQLLEEAMHKQPSNNG